MSTVIVKEPFSVMKKDVLVTSFVVLSLSEQLSLCAGIMAVSC